MKTSYFTKLSGTSFHQKELAQVNPGSTPLRAVPRPDNEYDQFAVEVQALLDDWTQIGWIQKGKNQDIQKALLDGVKVRIECTDITGQDKDTLGCNVGIEYGEDDSVEIKNFKKQIVVIGDEPFVYWDEENHNAYDSNGKLLMSGSRVERYPFPEFNPTYPAKALAKKTGVKAEDIKDMWEWNGDIASRYGTIIHEALEHYWLYNEQMMMLDDAKDRPCNAGNWMPSDLGEIVESFLEYADIQGEATPEVRVKYKQYTGIIDLLEKVPEGYIIHDYKVTRELKDMSYPCLNTKEKKYTLQQNCYRYIIEHVLGEGVVAMYLHQWNGRQWDKWSVERINDKVFEEELWKKRK